MNYVKVINKAEILLYSSLISVMSGINQLKNPAQEQPKSISVAPLEVNSVQPDAIALSPQRTAWINWASLQQTLLAVLLWTVLGLAAGFLLGMLLRG
jgi:ABC-type nitrate/sulfonate/bicarbonate transport system permease component